VNSPASRRRSRLAFAIGVTLAAGLVFAVVYYQLHSEGETSRAALWGGAIFVALICVPGIVWVWHDERRRTAMDDRRERVNPDSLDQQ
jgi:hypothetical protein